MISAHNVHIDEALKTRQFYQLWIVLCFNVTAGIGVLSVAQTMMTEIFGTTLPAIVDSGFAATYVVMISLFNMLGRFVWASSSDYIGRRNTYWIFFALGIVLYLSIPWVAQQVSVQPSVIWLVYFYAATMIIFTMYGGGFATIPAYLADMFGTRYVGGIHGRLLTAWSLAGVLGPVAITMLRERSIDSAIRDLVAHDRSRALPASVRRRHRAARRAGRAADGDDREAHGDRAARHRRSDAEPLQPHDVLDGRAARDRARRERADAARRREAPHGRRPQPRSAR